MKRFALFAAAALLLTGCTSQTPDAAPVTASFASALEAVPTYTPTPTPIRTDLRPAPSSGDLGALREAVASAGVAMKEGLMIEASRKVCFDGLMAGKGRDELLSVVRQQFASPSNMDITDDDAQIIVNAVAGTFCHA